MCAEISEEAVLSTTTYYRWLGMSPNWTTETSNDSKDIDMDFNTKDTPLA